MLLNKILQGLQKHTDLLKLLFICNNCENTISYYVPTV